MNINEIKNENNIINLNISISNQEFDEHFIRCEDCGAIVFKSEAIEYEDKYYCDDCVISCNCCGALHPINLSFQTDDSANNYCRYCYENATYICDDLL